MVVSVTRGLMLLLKEFVRWKKGSLYIKNDSIIAQFLEQSPWQIPKILPGHATV